MNYRHAFHAGNFADVMKHAVLAQIVQYLTRKEKPFRVIDVHAGIGLYDLTSDEARRGGEFGSGVGRLWEVQQNRPYSIPTLIVPFVNALTEFNANGRLTTYPGSPELVCRALRPTDRITLSELHPQDFEKLSERYTEDYRIRVLQDDAWRVLTSHIPPKERRGVVLIDPAFEVPNEFERLTKSVLHAVKRWRTGTYLIWYPVKDVGSAARMLTRFRTADLPPTLNVNLRVQDPALPGLGACGLTVINPPFTLFQQLQADLPWLIRLLARDEQAAGDVTWVGQPPS